MKNRLTLLSAFIGFAFTGLTQNYQVGFYNVENLFDTISNSGDVDFLPSTKFQWNTAKYNTKLKHINQVLDSVGNPILWGLAEIENKNVLEDLLNQPHQHHLNAIVHKDSPDERGIDVGLLYDSTKLKLIEKRFLFVALKDSVLTRDILAAKFSYKKDTIWAFVNHWPSRRGGQKESDFKRISAANVLIHFIDSISVSSPKSTIIAMGDLNDSPTDSSVQLLAQKLKPLLVKNQLKYQGTHNYKNEWEILDHLYFSCPAKKSKFQIIANSGNTLTSNFLIETFKNQEIPFRTYVGPKYLGGYSDHLPVYFKIYLR
jgi:predicted extracellular nuclease